MTVPPAHLSAFYDLPLFLIYAALSTTGAAIAKIAMQYFFQGRYRQGAWRFAVACVLVILAFMLFFYLLSHTDLSLGQPMAIAFNLLIGLFWSVVIFSETIDRWKALGAGAIIGGVILLSVHF